MAVSLQVIYPVSNNSTFDYDYYNTTHMDIVNQHIGAHIQTTLVTKGIGGGPDSPPAFYAIASFTFADQGTMGLALDAAGPVMADLPNFTNVQPVMLFGEVLG